MSIDHRKLGKRERKKSHIDFPKRLKRMQSLAPQNLAATSVAAVAPADTSLPFDLVTEGP